ncbi:hypothetical protein COW98_00790 [Candidatus Roizmanbacteria bacterium CG22_combo_CG10-13_8_21_14_all_35_9]|uniref:Uncharacterized protein n=2 Tax=Candidatus Roizmaniibacteriota TaxID=1752723 RepID=A0A2H0BZJ0_9BACT|nr:MAG: hypothetical protein COW98_00790 [Candidatus Roizmanbacteria bacterium CG22_combo_CG10-13_8_21_14_all_35_9]PIY70798.1 MAG: hypothetical protein COY88_03725 [Candidatus Roizmanbacteria bacterium CG_4_10_14_0_8_um_filter_35_28]
MIERRTVPIYLELHDSAVRILSHLVERAHMPPCLGSMRSNPTQFGAGIIFNEHLIITGNGKLILNGKQATKKNVISWLTKQPLPGSHLQMPTDEEFRSMVHF